MKQKYEFIKDAEKNTLVLREYAELDKDILSPLCEEKYEIKTIEAAAKEGKESLMVALRTKNMYPPGLYAEKIADTVTVFLSEADQDKTEILFNDIDLLKLEREQEALELAAVEEAENIDDLLSEENDFNEDFDDSNDLKGVGSIKVADDDFGDAADDS
jgi:hypothetical protein